MMELMLKKPHKLPPLKIQGKHIAGMRSIDKNYPSKLKTKFKKERSEDKRQSLPSSFEADILDLTSKELTEKERILIVSLQERIKIQRKVLEDRKHMVNAIRLNFERLERLLEQKEVENKLLKLKIHELQKLRPIDPLFLKGRSKLQNSNEKPAETYYRKKSVHGQRSALASRENSKVRHSPSNKQLLQRPMKTETSSPKKLIIQDVSPSSLPTKMNHHLQQALREVQKELGLEKKLRRELEEKYEKKQKELIKIKKELESLLRNSQKSSQAKLRTLSVEGSMSNSFCSEGEEDPELQIKKLNAKISIKKKIKKLENKLADLMKEQEESEVTPLKKKGKNKSKYSMNAVSPGDSSKQGEILALQQNIKTLAQQYENLELGNEVNFDDFNSTDTEDIEDYQILLQNEFSNIKRVCEQKNVCTLQRRELETTVQELQHRIQDKEQEWESLQEKFVALEVKIKNESKTQDEVQLLRQIIEEHESDLKMVNRKREMAEKQKNQLQTRIQLLYKEIVKSESKITDLSNNLAETEETKTLIAQKYNERDTEVKKLQTDLEKLNECVEELAHTCPIYPY